ncbi:MAM domain-containing protein 2 [Mizuhopecten yessoensis]|uniref:MAM domain-containing protein 2 n=1 Tax=Mizuhopecten yessoensis TaxID=6573 RepID=A0A210PLC6_MIZYE|nr:MAM domain-containing protein 2 [Mizuhopecten yessoensis]
MTMASFSIKLALLAAVVSMGTTSKQGCLDMYVFSSTYTTISNTLHTLEAQMKTLKAQLDATISSACLEPDPNVDTNTRFNLTYCDFEDLHMCNYTNEADGGYPWKTLAATAAISDHTYMGVKDGHMVYSYSSYSKKLTSRIFDRAPAYCIRFYLRAQYPTTQFTVYITEDGGVGYPIHSTAPHTPTTWTLVEVVPDSEYLSKPFKLTFKVPAGGLAYIDDIMVYNVPCNTPGIRKPVSCTGKELTIGSKKHCYTAHVEPRTYVDAIRTCKKGWSQSHLLSVTSAMVQHYIVDWIRNDTGKQASSQKNLLIEPHNIA